MAERAGVHLGRVRVIEEIGHSTPVGIEEVAAEGATDSARLNAGVRLRPNGLKQLLRRLGRAAGVPRVHAHRFRHTFATWAIAHDAREIDVQNRLGHSSPEMVRRYSATYGSAQAAERHAAFSPGDGMLVGALSAHPGGADGPPVSLRMP